MNRFQGRAPLTTAEEKESRKGFRWKGTTSYFILKKPEWGSRKSARRRRKNLPKKNAPTTICGKRLKRTSTQRKESCSQGSLELPLPGEAVAKSSVLLKKHLNADGKGQFFLARKKRGANLFFVKGNKEKLEKKPSPARDGRAAADRNRVCGRDPIYLTTGGFWRSLGGEPY